MATIFFILVLLAIFHLMYESILLPMFRVELRYKLFGLRDELRMLKSEKGDTVNDEVFYLLDDTICAIINRLPYFSISSRYDAYKEYDNNDQFKENVENTKKLISSCKEKDIQEINKNLMKFTSIGFVLNIGGWSYIIIPIVLVILFFAFITSKIQQIKIFIFNIAYKLTYSSGNNLNHFSNAD